MTADSPSPPVPLEDQLCFAIHSASMAIQRLYKPMLDEMGLTYPQYLVLNVLWREEGQSVGAIAARLALESSTLTPLLKRLEAAGLLRRLLSIWAAQRDAAGGAAAGILVLRSSKKSVC